MLKFSEVLLSSVLIIIIRFSFVCVFLCMYAVKDGQWIGFIL